MPANFEVVFVASGRYWPILLASEGPRPGRVVTNLRMFVGLWANGQTRPRSISAPVPTKAVDLRKRRRFIVSTSLAQCCLGEYAWDLGRELHELASRAKQGIGASSAIAGKGRFFVTFVLRKANRIFFPTTSFTCLRRSPGHDRPPGGKAVKLARAPQSNALDRLAFHFRHGLQLAFVVEARHFAHHRREHLVVVRRRIQEGVRRIGGHSLRMIGPRVVEPEGRIADGLQPQGGKQEERSM